MSSLAWPDYHSCLNGITMPHCKLSVSLLTTAEKLYINDLYFDICWMSNYKECNIRNPNNNVVLYFAFFIG